MGKILLGAGGLLAAIFASTCCVAPLMLGALGIGAAWSSTLNAVAAYEMFFRVAGIVFLATGFWLVYAPPKIAAQAAAACSAGPSQKLPKTLLWTGATVMTAVLLTRWLLPVGQMA